MPNKLKTDRIRREEVFKKTDDNWSANYPGNEVRVMLHLNQPDFAKGDLKRPEEELWVNKLNMPIQEEYGQEALQLLQQGEEAL